MLRDYLKKIVSAEGYNNKQRLSETDDFDTVYKNLNEFELRQLISRELNDELAWSEPLDKLIMWMEKHEQCE